MNLIIVILIIIIIIIVVAIILFFAISNARRKQRRDSFGEMVPQDNMSPQNRSETNKDLTVIHVEELPIEAIPDDGQLVEIKDKKILGELNSIAPGLFQASVAANNAVFAAKLGGETLYTANIPEGTTLVKSRTMDNAVRGFTRDNKGISHQANLVAADTPQGAAVVANSVASVMSVASMVVGLYYISQINNKLERINDSISKISNFQSHEFHSNVVNLMKQITDISNFQTEIISNPELRQNKLGLLETMGSECDRLLIQASNMLGDFTKKQNLNFKDYESAVKEAQNWYMWQNALLDVRYRISDLQYALYLGNASREQCMSSCLSARQTVDSLQENLTNWHENNIQKLNIDISEIRRKREGIDMAIHYVPGKFKDDLNYRAMDPQTADMIEAQMYGYGEVLSDTTELYNKEVRVISKDGKIFYLPET